MKDLNQYLIEFNFEKNFKYQDFFVSKSNDLYWASCGEHTHPEYQLRSNQPAYKRSSDWPTMERGFDCGRYECNRSTCWNVSKSALGEDEVTKNTGSNESIETVIIERGRNINGYF